MYFAIISKRDVIAQFFRRRCNQNMANIKSSAKRDEKSKELRAKNRAEKTELKTMMKKFDAAVAEGNKDAAADAYKVLPKAIRMPLPTPIKLQLRLLIALLARGCYIKTTQHIKSQL